MKFVLAMVLSFCASGLGFAQTATKALEFEVATVKQVAPPAMGGQTGGSRRTGAGVMSEMPDRITYEGVTLKAMLLKAYDLKPYQISGPAWLDDQHYDVVATIPEGATKEPVPEMLQHLLVERFKIVLHTEMKDEPVYTLAVGKGGSKLKATADENPKSPMGVDFNSKTGDETFFYRAETMAKFADILSRDLGHTVTDATGLDGKFDFTLQAEMQAGGGFTPVPSSVVSGVRDLGLELQSGKAPVKHMVIDKAEKMPTEN
jgi:uncharacterized protein (TIGR03435 family)